MMGDRAHRSGERPHGGSPGTPPPPAPASLTGLILAGGQARRLGGVDKGLSLWRGRPLVEWAIEALASQVEALTISANRNRASYEAYGYPVVADRDPGFLGPLSGIASALPRIRTPWVLCVPCDAPCAPPDLGVRLAEALLRDGADIAVASDGTRLQLLHTLIPVALARSLEDYLAAGERSVSGWYRRHRVAVAPFDDRPQAFANLNTPEDATRLEVLLATERTSPQGS